MRLVVFTCARDREKAALATRTVPASWSVAWVLDACDANLTTPARVEKLVVPFDRGRHLDSPAACGWVARVLAAQAKAHGRVAKMDSDCLLVDPSFLETGDLAGMDYPKSQGAVYGLAYALSAGPAELAERSIWDGFKKGLVPLAEDMVITGYARTWPGARLNILPPGSFWDATHRTDPPPGLSAIHAGCTFYAPREGPRVATEMRRLGDLLGIWRRP